jgi:hypothetical protein
MGDTNQADQSRERRGEIPGGGTDPQATPAPPEGVPPVRPLEDGTRAHGKRRLSGPAAPGTWRRAPAWTRPAPARPRRR